MSEKLTIREYFKPILDNKDVTLFRMVYHGQSYAGTDKKPTRVSIIIPKEIAENNLQFMNEWEFIIVAKKIAKEVKEENEDVRNT